MIDREIETTIAIPQIMTGEEPVARIWTASATVHLQMLKLGIKAEEASNRRHVFCAWYTVPRSWVQIGPRRIHRKKVLNGQGETNSESQREEV